MRKCRFLYFILLAICVNFLCAKDNFASEQKFVNGMPSELKFEWQEAFYAEIKAGEFYKKIYIVYKTDLDFPERSTIVLVKKSGGFSMTGCGFQACTDPNLFSTSIIIKTEAEDELEALNIQIDKNNKVFSYHWGEKDGNELPLIKKEYPLKPGKEFPSIQIENNFRNIDLGDSMNKIRVINWWATTCVPCIEEMPGLNTLVEKYRNKDIEFISIIWDHKNLDKFLNQNEYLYEHFATNSNVTNVLGETFPRNIVVDQNNIIRYNQTGGSKDKYKELDLLIQDIYKNGI